MTYLILFGLILTIKKNNNPNTTCADQGSYFRSTRNAQKFLAATWCLAAFILVNIYSSTLTSYMSLTFQKPEINSFKDLASSASYQATVAIGSIQELDVMESVSQIISNTAVFFFCNNKFYFNSWISLCVTVT